METEVLDSKLKEIVSSKEFVEKLLSLKTKDEVKKLFLDNGIEINDVEIEQLGMHLKKLVSKLINGELTDEQLQDLSAGANNEEKAHVSAAPSKFTRTVGQVASWPVRAVSYTLGAVAAGFPKGFYDGWTDTWYGYDK